MAMAMPLLEVEQVILQPVRQACALFNVLKLTSLSTASVMFKKKCPIGSRGLSHAKLPDALPGVC